MYLALQQYDLDVVPLRDSTIPPVHYAWIVDPTKEHAGYHCVGSRVHLSTGRPVFVSSTLHDENTAEIATDKSFILHRSMEEEERKNLEMRMADVDVDLAEKHGLVDEVAIEPEDTDDNLGRKKPSPESDSDGVEVDAF